MKLRELIRAGKTNVSVSDWRAGSKSFRAAYPLSKGSFKLPGGYRCSLITFDCDGRSYRVLSGYRLDKEQFVSYLGLDISSKDTALVARLEYHPTHPGWHVHPVCDESDMQPGRTRIEDRIPAVDARHRRRDFGIVDDRDAEILVRAAFGLPTLPPDLLSELQ